MKSELLLCGGNRHLRHTLCYVRCRQVPLRSPRSSLISPADNIMEPDRKDKFAIHEAAREGNVQTVESLLSANPKLARTKDDDDRLPIHWAVSYNRFPVVELLVFQKSFDPDVEDGSGWTPLMIAASLRDAEGDPILELLLQKDADVNVKSVSGQNALHFATSKINISTVRLLLANKCSARVKDKRGQLPLHRAAAVGSVPIMKMLLEEGKSPVNATDMDGLTALHHAVAEGHGDAAIFLLKAGAEADKRDSEGKLAIDLVPDQKVRQYILQTAEKEGIELP